MLACAQGLQLCNFCVLLCVVGGRESESLVCCNVFYWAARIPACTLIIEIQEYNHQRIEMKEKRCVWQGTFTLIYLLFNYFHAHTTEEALGCAHPCVQDVSPDWLEIIGFEFPSLSSCLEPVFISVGNHPSKRNALYAWMTSQPTSKVRKLSLGRHLKLWNRCPRGLQRKPYHLSVPRCRRQAGNGACTLWSSPSSHSTYRNRYGLIVRARDKATHQQHPQSIPVTAKGWFCYVLFATKYRLQTSTLTGCVRKDLLQELQLHNGNQHWPKIFGRNIFWEKNFKLNQNSIFCRKISIVLKSSRKNFMTASHLDKAEKRVDITLYEYNMKRKQMPC